jgi:hypothetical protein
MIFPETAKLAGFLPKINIFNRTSLAFSTDFPGFPQVVWS